MKLEGTKDKLEEAQFFLRHLKAAQNEQTEQPFQYYLSAFLNAAFGVQTTFNLRLMNPTHQAYPIALVLWPESILRGSLDAQVIYWRDGAVMRSVPLKLMKNKMVY